MRLGAEGRLWRVAEFYKMQMFAQWQLKTNIKNINLNI
jgi:hypothetical protein